MNKNMQAKCDELKKIYTAEKLPAICRKEFDESFTAGFKACYSELEPVLREAMKALKKINSNEFLTYSQGNTDSEHHYKMGITDGHRLCKNWAYQAL